MEAIAKRNLSDFAQGPLLVRRNERVKVISVRAGPHCELFTVRAASGLGGEWADHCFKVLEARP